MEETQERLLNREATKIEIGQPALPFAELDPEVKLAIECAADRKAFDMRVLDLRDIASFTEFFIIASGANQRQVQAIADAIEEQLKKQLQTRPVRIEGYNSAEWVLMDYFTFIVHVFTPQTRAFYSLERLWGDAERIEVSEDAP